MSHKSRNQCFSYYFCLLIEGSGSISLTNGSGFLYHKAKIRIPEAQKHMDPQHCRKERLTWLGRANFLYCHSVCPVFSVSDSIAGSLFVFTFLRDY
jgi:hypothetical protein